MQIKYSETAVKQLKKSALLIIEAIEKYANNPEQSQSVKVLKGNMEDFK